MKKLSIIIPTYNRDDLLPRCLNSIEPRDDIEVIIVNDCSTDNTEQVIEDWLKTTTLKTTVINSVKNEGTGLTLNKGFDIAKGEDILIICDDDYFIQPLDIINELDGTDIIYFNLETNDGSILEVNEKTKNDYCGGTKIIRREFMGDLRRSPKRIHGDRNFYKRLLKKNPTEKFTGINLIHYDYPRDDTLTTYARKNGIGAGK